MRTINNRRPKAFIGAAISVGTQLIGGIIGGAKRRKAEEAARLEQERQAKLQAAKQQASYMTENAENDANVYKNIRNQLMRNGGNIPRKGAAPLIAEGGTAVPIKKNTFLLKGRKHDTGGIVIGKGKNSIEAEGEEVVQITPKQLKVFSAQPILNGNSPAELVQKGAEPSKVFNAQEEFKDKNNLNDDGTKNNSKMKNGGIRKIYPSLSGRYYGKNEGRAIRSLREARSNPNYQYNGNNIPSMPSLNSELKPIKREEPVKKEVSKPKKQSFSSAFVEARRQGLKVFEWNGKKYGTQLASEVTKKPIINKVEPKVTKETKIEPKTKTKVQTIERELPEVVITAPRKKQSTLNNNVNSNKVEPKSSKTNIIPEVNVVGSRIPKMIKDNTFVPSQYSSNNNITVPRESTSVSLYKGIKSILGVPERRRKKLGGLSRSKDYGSDKKPYPSVKSNDFAGGGRSYPIPTKADARDALRLAGLHGRSDVKAKVYKKYPELKNKKATLGTFGSLTGANRRLLALNQNVPSAGITAGAKIIKPSASSIKPMNLSSNNGSKGFNLFKGIDKGEAISSGIGAVGTLISGLLNKGSIDKTSAPQVPTPQLIAPAKLKTSVNINPQLSDVRESELSQNRLVEGNTASSVASVARQQRISNNALSQRSRLRGEKENLETQLQNQDAINRQQVASSNAQQINEANRFNSISATQTANDKIQAIANNRTQMIEGITSGVRDYQLGVDKKRSEENAIAAMMSANPEQMELFLKLMEKNKGRLGNVRSTLFRCGGKKKIA
jgi:hypothetical protein